MAETASTQSKEQLLRALHDIARVATVMFDGELCHQIVTDRSWKWMSDFDPDERFSRMDNYDVEHEPFVQAKKTLLRLQKLAPDGVDVRCLLWRDVPTLQGKATCLIHNGGANRWQGFGMQDMDATAEQSAALAGEVCELDADDAGVLTVLAPVRDSFKEVSGFIEISAPVEQPAIFW